MGMKHNLRFRISDFGFKIILSLTLFIFLIPYQSISGQVVKIGVALPLFEDSDESSKKELGNDILNGIKFALSDYSKKGKTNIILDIMDTKRDINNTVNICNGFAENDSISCILGPVFSSELAEVADIGSSEKIPIISPTATGDELAETHDYIFQLNPSYEVRGKLMADYLTQELGMTRFVVISEENYGKNFRTHFEDETEKQGGKILLSKTYSKDSKNINEIVTEILKVIRDNDLFINISNLNAAQREKLENIGVRYSLIDSLQDNNKDVSIYHLFGKNALKIIDTLSIKPFTLKSNGSGFIQGYIDAIYIPISNPAEISMLVPELFSNGLSFFLAGTGDWNNELVLEENKMYIKNLIFESEYFPDYQGSQYLELKSKLSKTTYKLNKNFLFGYDAMEVLLNVISSGNVTRRQINDALEKIISFDAIVSKISLDYSRVNSELNILSYDNKLNRIGVYKLEK
jgi:hypothetical protein